jgi:O-antigen/teichoic acid export membrane protein
LTSLIAKILSQLGIGKAIAKDSLWSFALRTSQIGLTFLTTVLLARILGPTNYGVYAYALAIIMLLSMPIQMGLPDLVVRETAKYSSKNQPEFVLGIWIWSQKIILLFSTGAIIIIGPFLVWWQGGLNTLSGQTLTLALISIPINAFSYLWSAILRGFKKIAMGLLPELVLLPLSLLILLGIALILLPPNVFSAPIAMVLYLLAVIVTLALTFFVLNRNIPIYVKHAQPSFKSNAWLLSGITFALLAGVNTINAQSSTVILGIFWAPEHVGQYRIALQVATLASFGLQAINQVVAPRFAELWAKNEHRKLQKLVTRSAQIILAFNIIITITFVLLGKSFFIFIFGNDFGDAFYPLLIMLIGQMINSATGSVGFLLNMTGHEKDTATTVGLAGLINIIFSFMLIPKYNIVGAAISYSISMIVWNLILWWRVHQRLGINSVAFNFKNNSFL